MPTRPTSLPHPPTPENVPKLETFIREKFASTAFYKTPPFPAISGPPAKINLKTDAVPYARHTPIPIPHHCQDEVKASLDRDVARGIITPGPIGTPVTWCSPMVIVAKDDGSPRRTIDFQRLNKQCLRETHHTATQFHLASQVQPHSKKTVIDDGFHSVPLDPES